MARKRVNKRFLVGLVSVFGAIVLGLLFAGMWYKDSPERAVRRATEADERGDREEAAGQWNKAYQRTGEPEYLMKAIDSALSDTTGTDGPDWIGRALMNYQALLASAPDYMPARRGQLELRASDRAFDASVLTGATREVREVAGEILEREPNDTEARALHAIATLNLSQFRGSGVTQEDKAAALETLKKLVLSDPGDGRPILALTEHYVRQAVEAVRTTGNVEGALEIFREGYSTLEKAEPIVGEPGDDATLEDANRSRYLGQAFLRLADLKAGLDRELPGGATRPSEPAATETVEGVRAKAIAHLENAVKATDPERDVLTLDYLRIHGVYADALNDDGQEEAALKVLQDLAEARPWDAQAAAALATMLLQQRRFEEAEQVTTAALARQSEPLPRIGGTDGMEALLARFLTKPVFIDVLMTRAEQLRGNRQAREADERVEQARGVFASYESERATRRASITPQILRIRGQLQQADNDMAGAIATYEEALRMLDNAPSVERARLLSLTGQANLALNQLGEAREAYEQLYQMNSGNLGTAYRLASILINTGDVAGAQPYIDQLLKADPQNSVYQRLAMAATPTDDRGARLADMPEETLDQRKIKFDAAVRLGNHDEAIRIGRLLVAQAPDVAGLQLALAAQLHAADQQEEALTIARALAEAGDENAQSLLGVWKEGVEGLLANMEGPQRLVAEARLAQRRGDVETAIAKYAQAHQAEPENTQTADQLFQLYLEQGSLDKAAQVGSTLSRLNADRLDGRSYDIRLKIARGETAQAVEEARQLSLDFRTAAQAHALYGQALAAAGRFSEAEEPLRRALEMAPTNVSTISMLVVTLERLNRGAQSEPLIRSGLRIDPGNALLAAHLRRWELRFGDAEKLIAEHRKAVADQPDNAQSRLELVEMLLAASSGAAANDRPADVTRYAGQAIDAAIEARKQFPQDPRFLRGVAVAAPQADDAAKARAAAEVQSAVADNGPLAGNLEAAVIAADYFAQTGRPAQAETLLRGLLAKDDLARQQRAGLLLGLSQLAARGGREDEALALLSGYEDLPPVVERKAELLGVRFVRENGSESAYQALRQATDKAVEEDTLGPGGLNVLAIAEMQRKNFDRARTLLERSIQKDSHRGRTYALQAALLTQQPDPDPSAAADRLQHAASLDEGDLEILTQLAQLQSSLGRSEAAATTLRRLLALNPRDVGARLSLINLLLAERDPRYADAAAQFRAAQEASVGEHPMLLNARAWMEMRRGQRNEAIATGKQSITAAAGTPQEASLLNSYLRLLQEAGAYQQVLDTLQERPAPEGENPWWVLRARGQALAGLNRDEEAVAAYTEAYASAAQARQDVAVLREMGREISFDAAWALISPKVEPQDGTAPAVNDLNAAALLLVDEGRRDEAIERLNEALREVPAEDEQRRAVLQLQVGTLHLQSVPPHYQEAEGAFREALKGLPQDLGALNNLAYTLTLRADQVRGVEERGRMLDEAVKVARRAYDLSAQQGQGSGPNPSITDTYAGAIARKARQTKDMGALRNAERLLRQARQAAEANNNPFPEVYLHLGQVQRDLGNRAGAADTATAGINLLAARQAEGEEVDATVAEALRELLGEVSTEASSSDAEAENGAE